MSVWGNICKRADGTAKRKEDIEIEDVYFKLRDCYDVPIPTWKPNSRIIFNQKTDNMCVGEFITCSRVDLIPIFKLVNGSKCDLEKGVVFTLDGIERGSRVNFVNVLTDFNVNR